VFAGTPLKQSLPVPGSRRLKFALIVIRPGINKVEICSNCHPFYTGKQRTISKQGRVEKFNLRYNINKEK
jgi:ribosomal protein L31